MPYDILSGRAESVSVSKEALRSLALPRVPEEGLERPSVDARELHSDRRQSFAPPDALTRPGPTVDCGEDSTFVEHDVHVVIVPLRREDLSGHAKGRAAVMILLDRLGKAQRELSCLCA